MLDQDLLMKAVLHLQAEGVQGIMTAEQYRAKHGRAPKAHNYYHGTRGYAKSDRHGEELSVVLNTSWADVAGISATKGDLIGGVHREGTPEGQDSATEIEVKEKLRKLRKTYNSLQAERAAKRVASRLGGRVTSPQFGTYIINVQGRIDL